MSDLGQYLNPTIRTIEATLKESKKRIPKGRRTDALWFLWRAFEELEEAEVILAAHDRAEAKRDG
jgi:hypothetical protein